MTALLEAVPLELSISGAIPTPLLTAPASAMAASFRILRRRLHRLGDPAVVAVTSASQGEGKTTCALGLALAIAEDLAEPVVLVEANCRRPRLASALGFTPPACVLRQLESESDAAHERWLAADIGFHRLGILAIAEPREEFVLSTARLRRVLDAAKASGARHVLIDGPSVSEGAEMHVIEALCDGVLLTARSLRTKASALRRAADDLGPAGILGTVLMG
jgi:Mrp family chromosome partitioning ATPase